MTEAEALAKLELMALSDEEPVLSSDQLEDCLDNARRPDADDLGPSDSGWTGTWDLDYAAAEAWRRKAGIASGRFSFAEDGQRFERAQVYAHCMSQAEMYARRSMGAIDTSGSTQTT